MKLYNLYRHNKVTKLCLILFIILNISCTKTKKIDQIKHPVFGGFVLGSTLKEHQSIVDSLKFAGNIYTTTNTNHDFLVIDDKSIVSLSRTLLFPIAQYNTDSVITRMIYYVYVLEMTSVQAIEQSDITEYDRDNLRELSEKTSDKLQSLVNNFSITSNLDKQYRYFYPNQAQGSGFENHRTRDKISGFLNTKYSSLIVDETIGNEYDESDFSFSKLSVWKTENVDIKLITRRYPMQDKSSDFHHILIYEFNDDIKSKYNLEKKQQDIRNTF